MKKIYFSISLLMSSLTIQAQQTIDFESFNLMSESFYNGSDEAGGFTLSGVIFPNEYNSTWSSWSGFSVSNVTDNTTAGVGNQYAAFAGSGGDNSANYAVYGSNGSISFSQNDAEGLVPVAVSLTSIQVTNTSYAALSMRDGDSFAKQFGSVNNADGDLDGTNGEDFFKLWIVALDSDNSRIDSVEVFLADYRFADNNEDFILDTWLTVDLSVITEQIYGLDFKLESSDVGGWGMNTPAYFALDNLVFNKSASLNNIDLDNKISVYPNPIQNQLSIKGESGIVEIFDATGNLVLSTTHNYVSVLNVEQLAQGSYILKISNEHGVYSKKLIK